MNIRGFFSTLLHRAPRAISEKNAARIDGPQYAEEGLNAEQDLDRKLVIVDIGCRWGFAERFANGRGYFRVYGLDPDPEECQR